MDVFEKHHPSNYDIDCHRLKYCYETLMKTCTNLYRNICGLDYISGNPPERAYSMYIHCLGLNHTTTPISIREKLSFNDDHIRAALARLGCGGMHTIAELIILSTCNRIELYAISSQYSFSVLESFLSETRGVAASELNAHLYHFIDSEAVGHLFKVATGLDSLVLGEPQILGQVTHALELARGQNTAGSFLNRLFQSAIHTGKRARAETAISRNSASVSSLAASVAEKNVRDVKQARVVVMGAGEMAELAVEALRKRGMQKIVVVNRTLERAQELVERWGAEAATFESIDQVLRRADILISSTGAPHIIISTEMVRHAMQFRPELPLVLLDIAVPRNIEPEVTDIPHVKLFDIDHLNTNLEQSLAERAAQVPMVEKIIQEEIDEFLEFLGSLEMIRLIADLQQQAESIRRTELEKTLRRLPDLTDSERTNIEAMSMALVKKILASPTSRLRAEAACPHAPEYAAVARTLFNLPGERGLCGFSGSTCPISTAAY